MNRALHYIKVWLFVWAMALQGANRPNVLFMLTDDQRADSVGVLGNPNVKTPNMDHLIESGTFFSQTYIQGSMTPATCLPSRAMIMSGKSLFRAPMQLDKGKLLPEVFSEAGYTTFATGKWHNGAESFLKCFEQGEAIFLGGAARDHYRVPLNYRDGKDLVPYEVPGVFSTTLFADAAISFLKKQKDTHSPFFCYVPFTAPHSPFVPPEKYADMYDPNEIVLPPNHAKNLSNTSLPTRRGLREGTPENMSAYYGMISHLDSQIGRILETLESINKTESTIIVFASDHGLSMQSHGKVGKHNAHEDSSRSLLSISGPGIPKNKRNSALAYLFDIYPSLCELTGIQIPESVEGQSLAGVIKGKESKVRDFLFTAYIVVLKIHFRMAQIAPVFSGFDIKL
jgi:arylsulfatase A-like enzyme